MSSPDWNTKYEHSTAHPLATVGAIEHTATSTGVDAGTLAGHLLAECGEDTGAIHYLSQVFVERAYNDYGRTLRHAHTLWHGHDTHGDEDKALQASPDGYERVKSATVQRRSNTGTSYRETIIHGRSYVGGSRIGTPNSGAAMSVAHIAHALDTAPRTVFGHVDGIAINRLVDVTYPDLPRLSGADTIQFADFAAYDEIRAATPRRGWKMVTSVPRVPAGAYDAAPHEVVSFRSDEYTTTDADGRETVHPATVFIGHRVADRIASYRDQRATRVRSVTEAFTVTSAHDVPMLLAVIGNDEPGRWTWTDGTASGAITVTSKGRIGVTGLGVDIRGARTIGAAQRAAARAIGKQ